MIEIMKSKKPLHLMEQCQRKQSGKLKSDVVSICLEEGSPDQKISGTDINFHLDKEEEYSKTYDGRLSNRWVRKWESFLYPRDAETLYIRSVMSYYNIIIIISQTFVIFYCFEFFNMNIFLSLVIMDRGKTFPPNGFFLKILTATYDEPLPKFLFDIC